MQSSQRNLKLSLDKNPRMLGLKVCASDLVPVHCVRAGWFECLNGILFSADFPLHTFVIRIQWQMCWGLISEVTSLLKVEGSVWLSRLKNWVGKQRNSSLLSSHILPSSNPLFYWCSCESCSAMWVLHSSQHCQVWMKCHQKLIGAPLCLITYFTINLTFRNGRVFWGPIDNHLWRCWVIGSFCLCCFSSHEYCLLSNSCLPKSRIPSHSCRSTRQQWLFIPGCKNGPFSGLSHE